MDYQQAKIHIVKTINEARAENALEPLQFDQQASDAADQHCKEMVDAGYISHWSLNGDKPYQRYFKAGIKDHVSENIVGTDGVLQTDVQSVEKQMRDSQTNFMTEVEGNDLNKQNTLDPRHTHIGIGVACTESSFRYVEVYLDRYVELADPPTLLAGTELTINGKVLKENFGPYALTVYHDPPSDGISAEDIKEEKYTGGYPDFSDKQAAVTWPWEMKVEDDGTFSIPVSMPEVDAGTYYFQLYVKADKSSIPYDEHERGVTVPSPDSICATGLVATYQGEKLRAGDDPQGLGDTDQRGLLPITEISVVVGGNAAVSEGFEPVAVLGTTPDPTQPTLSISVARGTQTGVEPITDLTIITGDNESGLVTPAGFNRTTENLGSLNQSGFAFLCFKRAGSGGAEAAPLTDICLAYGSPPSGAAGYTVLEVASPPVFICYRSASDQEDMMLDGDEILDADFGDEIQPGDVMLEEEEEDAVLDEEAEAEEEMSPEELAEAEARAAEAEERRRIEKAKADEEAARLAQAEHMRRTLEEAGQSKERLLLDNHTLQKQLVPYLQRKAEGGSQKEEKGNFVENEKRYYDALANVIEERSRLQRAQAQYDRIAMDLQARLDEKEYKANEIAESFRDFKREIARGAENSRTAKPIPKKIIQQFEVTESKKDQDVEKVRLKNINLRTHLRKLEHQLRAKEQLAEGLHLIDFEQLKIENQTLNEKIEERNEELHKLRKKTTMTVQVLTHIKEKLQFIQVENQSLKRELADLDSELTHERDGLTKAKRERDQLRQDNAQLRQKQGFVNSDLLVQDFEQRKIDMQQLRSRLAELKQRHSTLSSDMNAMKSNLDVQQGGGAVNAFEGAFYT